jgi:hypothetical protein
MLLHPIRHTPPTLPASHCIRGFFTVAGNQTTSSAPFGFQVVRQNQIPKGREGKHKQFISLLLQELHHMRPGLALKVPLSGLPATKANIRAALNRETRKKGLAVATSSDSANLYIWKVTGKP